MQLAGMLSDLWQFLKSLIRKKPSTSNASTGKMNPRPELVAGLELLTPFLTNYGFAFDNYENGVEPEGRYTTATFSKGNKAFIIGYRNSVSHRFYLDGLGYAAQKQFPSFQSPDRLLPFRTVLHDFEYVVADFFNGDCSKLKIIAEQEEEVIGEYNRQGQDELNNSYDRLHIRNAAVKFKEKDYQGCLDIYSKIQHPELLTEFDNKAIAYCKKHL